MTPGRQRARFLAGRRGGLGCLPRGAQAMAAARAGCATEGSGGFGGGGGGGEGSADPGVAASSHQTGWALWRVSSEGARAY
eukprot:SAG31_NODE_2281_length_6022_cov_3.327706_10_plen_81_part_00